MARYGKSLELVHVPAWGNAYGVSVPDADMRVAPGVWQFRRLGLGEDCQDIAGAKRKTFEPSRVDGAAPFAARDLDPRHACRPLSPLSLAARVNHRCPGLHALRRESISLGFQRSDVGGARLQDSLSLAALCCKAAYFGGKPVPFTGHLFKASRDAA